MTPNNLKMTSNDFKMTSENEKGNDEPVSKDVKTKKSFRGGNPNDDNSIQGRDLIVQAFPSQ